MNVQERLTGQPNDEGLPTPQNGPSDAQTRSIEVGAGVGAGVAPAPGGPRGYTFIMDPGIIRARLFIINHIFGKNLQGQPQPANNATIEMLKDHSLRLEDCLFTKLFTECYRNLRSLRNRMAEVFRRQNEQRSSQQPANSSGVQGHQSGPVPNQGGPPPLQNGPSAVQIPNSSVGAGGPPINTSIMPPELVRARIFIRDHIFATLLPRQTQPVDHAARLRLMNYVRVLENGLFKLALEDYMNLETLDTRFDLLVIRGHIQPNQTQQPPINLMRRRVTARDHLMEEEEEDDD